ncbi:hypothetical protein HBH56_107190 [Parastagonospora nodorum]|nr:hypothetical protein HBH56_107190 [Parastagonospora nodorum]KAH3929373.1 hypothetical protein HBH54_123230 [Parastagonospora nodorum]KAH3975251.1 hypothetical protein HBH52_129560 [Parastagonospora nodorum]KAH3978751.1 hypothetical protein HBH51_066490 [Parastagonospora nodorum]KAH3999257.1 hypothetical protein HBI10_122940 [Parastagonospora nodorum]
MLGPPRTRVLWGRLKMFKVGCGRIGREITPAWCKLTSILGRHADNFEVADMFGVRSAMLGSRSVRGRLSNGRSLARAV